MEEVEIVEAMGVVEEVEAMEEVEVVEVMEEVVVVEVMEVMEVTVVVVAVELVLGVIDEVMDRMELELELVGLVVGVVTRVMVVVSGWDLFRPPIRSLTDWTTLSTLASSTLSTGYLGVLAGGGEERRQLVSF